MSPEELVLLESGARVSSALVLGVFLVVAVRTVLNTTGRRRTELEGQLADLRGAVEDLGWRVDQLHEHHGSRLHAMEQRLDFTEQLLRRPAATLEARH